MKTQKKPLKIGLTGSPGAGKSLVLRFLAQKGVPTLQTDHLGHGLLRDKVFSEKLARLFGRAILDPRGRVDRRKLGSLVFRDPEKRDLLNRTIHPRIREAVAAWVRRKAGTPKGLVVVEVPLLFERGFYRFFDGNLSVSAPAVSRRKRLARRGWDAAEVKEREEAQWPQTRKDRMADWVLRNDGTPDETRRKVSHWLSFVKSGPKGPKKKVF